MFGLSITYNFEVNLIFRLTELSLLQKNWNTYGGSEQISKISIGVTRLYLLDNLNNMLNEKITHIYLNPLSCGGIQIEYITDENMYFEEAKICNYNIYLVNAIKYLNYKNRIRNIKLDNLL